MVTIAAVVVTRNRPALLKLCLAAIDAQTYPISQLVVVDNASDQPAQDLLKSEAARRGATFHLLRSEENLGGAGGFHAGMRACLDLPCTHMWLMDDDCEPDADAAKELVAAMTVVGETVVLGGNVFDLDGNCMNLPSVALKDGPNGVPQFPRHLAAGLLEVSSLTFVSFLVPTELVRKVGLPLKEFFIWYDDHEYSLRLGRITDLYQVGRSKVLHCKSGNAAVAISRERDYNRLWQYRLLYRNRLYVIKTYYGYFSIEMAKFLNKCRKDIMSSVQSREFVLMKCKTILYGMYSGISLSIPLSEKT